MVILAKANLMNILEVILMTEIDVNLISEIILDYGYARFYFFSSTSHSLQSVFLQNFSDCDKHSLNFFKIFCIM